MASERVGLTAQSRPRSGTPAGEAAEAVSRTVRQSGVRGCAGLMARESGDHPEAAVDRTRCLRQLAAAMLARLAAIAAARRQAAAAACRRG